MGFKQRPPELKIFSIEEKRVIVDKLKAQFGIERLDGLILARGAERLFLYQGSLSPKEISDFERMRVNIERCGVYFAKIESNTHRGTSEVRLSIEGVHVLKDQIKKNIYELDEEQARKWMEGSELNIKIGMGGFVVIRHGDYFLGCGKASAEKIGNFIPKNRRLKIRQN